MKMGKRRYEDVCILQFTGELGSFNLPVLKQRIDAMLQGGDSKFVLEARHLSFVNSAAIGYLIRLAKEAKEEGGGVVLAAPSQFLKDTLITLQITHLFPIYDRIQDGILHFREGADVSALDLTGLTVSDPPPIEVPVHFRSREDASASDSDQVGRIVKVREDSLLFQFGPVEGADYESLSLVPGAILRMSFQQPFVVKDYVFEIEGEVEHVHRLEEEGVDHGVSVRVAYSDMKSVDRMHLGQFARDQALWRAERDAD